MKGVAILLADAILATPAQAQPSPPHALICAVERDFMCAPDWERCEVDTQKRAPGWSLVDFDAGTYSICEPKGCRTLNAVFQRDGIYVNISLPGGGGMARLEAGSNRLMEFTTFMLGAFVAYMNCRPAK